MNPLNNLTGKAQFCPSISVLNVSDSASTISLSFNANVIFNTGDFHFFSSCRKKPGKTGMILETSGQAELFNINPHP
jgi:hypothetical protein